MDPESLPSGWEVWSDEATRIVLAYRPDVFDTVSVPAACMPTLYLSKGLRDRRPGAHDPPADADWHVTLYLEPEVNLDPARAPTRAEAIDVARDLAEQFATGEVDYRACYQVPRPDYFEKLDELTGRADDGQPADGGTGATEADRG